MLYNDFNRFKLKPITPDRSPDILDCYKVETKIFLSALCFVISMYISANDFSAESSMYRRQYLYNLTPKLASNAYH